MENKWKFVIYSFLHITRNKNVNGRRKNFFLKYKLICVGMAVMHEEGGILRKEAEVNLC